MSKQDWFSKQTEGTHSHLSDLNGSMPDEEFNGKTLRLAQMLAERFPERNARIGLWGENSLDYVIALFAVLRAGHVAVPLNTRLSARELQDLAEAAGLSGVLASRDFPQSHREVFNGLSMFALAQKLAPLGPNAKPPRMRELGEKDVAVLLCSSGSSGKPKIVPFTLRSLFSHARAVCSHLNVTWRDSWVACLPLYHVGGLAIPFRCMVSGASLILSQSSDPDDLHHLITAENVTLISVVPTALERMLNKRGSDPYPKTLRGLLVGGGPVADALLARCDRAYATYGLTEAGSMVSCARPGCGDKERRTAGPALPDTEIKIVDEKGKDIRKGEAGQILVRGPGMAAGYLGNSEASARTFRSGWIHTGDIGRLDESGLLKVEARRGDIVLSGGENIYPAEIEAALKKHPRVEAAIVLPVDHPEWGQTPAALIVLKPGRPLEKTHIYMFLEGHLARYKFPKKILFADALPLLSTGKPDLAAIRKMLKG
ncbi:MAG TPA: o-succinylbenzoate--CoA ligase [bacterium]|jgi:O-succinylbenzoic acid--CoA ligase